MTRTILTIRGLHNRSSASNVARSLKATKGVAGVAIDVQSRSACVEHDEQADVGQLISAVKQAGLQVDGFNRSDAEA
ncbi:MAG: heavy-metal-associated domain-containing protein [Phycisphaerae bacterium]|nr:heavy-metal-associated domain-containing protein [Phycisphaerae bacterium]